MIFSKCFNPTKLFKTSLLALAALGLALPTASSAQPRLSDDLPSRAVLENGTYLFGQSPERDVIGAAYIVLSVENNRTVGAFYKPHSSYDCFSGEVSPTRLAVEIVDSYSQAVYPYAISLSVTDSLVAGSGAGTYTLDGFHRIGELSARDAEILAVCEADFAE
ncbi:MAG: hypothetical protein AAF703_09000 [Cyanobacteria bacterium P01_D01_bin.105]